MMGFEPGSHYGKGNIHKTRPRNVFLKGKLLLNYIFHMINIFFFKFYEFTSSYVSIFLFHLYSGAPPPTAVFFKVIALFHNFPGILPRHPNLKVTCFYLPPNCKPRKILLLLHDCQ